MKLEEKKPKNSKNRDVVMSDIGGKMNIKEKNCLFIIDKIKLKMLVVFL